MNLPNDPAMLLSVVNLKLRDYYNSLSELCEDMDVNIEDVTSILASIDYEYDSNLNQFV